MGRNAASALDASNANAQVIECPKFVNAGGRFSDTCRSTDIRYPTFVWFCTAGIPQGMEHYDRRDLIPLEGERVWKILHPHPLACAREYLTSLFIFIWIGVLVVLDGTGKLAPLDAYLGRFGHQWMLFILWAIGMFIFGLAVSFAVLRRAWLIFLFIIVIILGMLFMYNMSTAFGEADALVYLFVYTLLIGTIAFIPVEVWRRSFKYYITTNRIVIIERFMTSRERTIWYNQIEKVDVYKTITGRIFNFGTVTPITSDDTMETGASTAIIKLRMSPTDTLYCIREPDLVEETIYKFMYSSGEGAQLRDIKKVLLSQRSRGTGRKMAPQKENVYPEDGMNEPQEERRDARPDVGRQRERELEIE